MVMVLVSCRVAGLGAGSLVSSHQHQEQRHGLVDLAKSGLCASSGTTNVTLELDVFQTMTATLGSIKVTLVVPELAHKPLFARLHVLVLLLLVLVALLMSCFEAGDPAGCRYHDHWTLAETEASPESGIEVSPPVDPTRLEPFGGR